MPQHFKSVRYKFVLATLKLPSLNKSYLTKVPLRARPWKKHLRGEKCKVGRLRRCSEQSKQTALWTHHPVLKNSSILAVLCLSSRRRLGLRRFRLQRPWLRRPRPKRPRYCRHRPQRPRLWRPRQERPVESGLSAPRPKQQQRVDERAAAVAKLWCSRWQPARNSRTWSLHVFRSQVFYAQASKKALDWFLTSFLLYFLVNLLSFININNVSFVWLYSKTFVWLRFL